MMLETLKNSGKSLGHNINQAWRHSAEGWRDLLHRSSDALTRFTHTKKFDPAEKNWIEEFPQWGLLSSEIEETDKEIFVRIEVPGMSKEDCTIRMNDHNLYLSGEKHFNRDSTTSTYHLKERAYGSFQRVIPLPRSADTENANASYKNGVVSIRIPKIPGIAPKSIHVN